MTEMNEQAELPYYYKYKRMMVAIDVVIFTIFDSKLKVLLVKRSNITAHPKESDKKDYYSLLGGIVRFEETFDQAVNRVLQLKAHIQVETQEIYVEQLYTFDAIDRDPRDRVLSVSYYTLVKPEKIALIEEDNLEWVDAYNLPEKLVIDHAKILDTAIKRLVGKIEYNTIPFSLLDEKFTFSQLQSIYEALLNTKLEKRNFRKKFADRKKPLIIPTGEYLKIENEPRRPVQLYKLAMPVGTILKRSLFD